MDILSIQEPCQKLRSLKLDNRAPTNNIVYMAIKRYKNVTKT